MSEAKRILLSGSIGTLENSISNLKRYITDNNINIEKIENSDTHTEESKRKWLGFYDMKNKDALRSIEKVKKVIAIYKEW